MEWVMKGKACRWGSATKCRWGSATKCRERRWAHSILSLKKIEERGCMWEGWVRVKKSRESAFVKNE
ncbi:hypothetical protein Hanom_Chr06g00512581 [Helianthus anomalus]